MDATEWLWRPHKAVMLSMIKSDGIVAEEPFKTVFWRDFLEAWGNGLINVEDGRVSLADKGRGLLADFYGAAQGALEERQIDHANVLAHAAHWRIVYWLANRGRRQGLLESFYHPELGTAYTSIQRDDDYRILVACLIPTSQLALVCAWREERAALIAGYRLRMG